MKKIEKEFGLSFRRSGKKEQLYVADDDVRCTRSVLHKNINFYFKTLLLIFIKVKRGI